MQASLFGYVETDYPLAPKEQVEANEGRTRRSMRRSRRSGTRCGRSTSRIEPAGAGEVQEVSGQRAGGHRNSGSNGLRARRCWRAR